jgi:hypothetical protein
MLVGVIHKISDPASWSNTLSEAERGPGLVPEGLGLPVSVHSGSGDYAFCLWQAPSVEALQSQLDPMTEGIATNTYFAVNPGHPGTNLPAGIPAQATDVTDLPAASTTS